MKGCLFVLLASFVFFILANVTLAGSTRPVYSVNSSPSTKSTRSITTSPSTTQSSSSQSERLIKLVEQVGRGMAGECHDMTGYLLVEGERWNFSLESGSTFLRSPAGKSWRKSNNVKLMTTDSGDLVPLQATRDGLSISFNCGY